MASPITYEPINPSFGGNPLNSSHLFNEANVDRPEKKTSAPDARDNFGRTVTNSVLARIASDISTQILDSAGLPSNTFTVEGTVISYTTSGSTRTVTITNPDGTSTTVQFPI